MKLSELPIYNPEYETLTSGFKGGVLTEVSYELVNGRRCLNIVQGKNKVVLDGWVLNELPRLAYRWKVE